MRFAEIRDRIVNNPGFGSLEEIKKAGYRIVKERDGERYFLTRKEDLKPLLVRLGDVAEVRFGIKTGANEFFYLEPVGMSVAEVVEISQQDPSSFIAVKNGAGWEGEIEAEFLKPVIKSPREIKTIRVRLEDLHYLVFMCHLSKEELQEQGKTCALEYIHWGERKGYPRRPTCKSRQRWWDLGVRQPASLIWPMIHNDRIAVSSHDPIIVVDHNLFEISATDGAVFSCLMVASYQILNRELVGRSNLGEGAVKTEGMDIVHLLVLNPTVIVKKYQRRLFATFEMVASRELKTIFEELGLPRPNRDYSNINPEDVSLDKILPDRRELDSIIFSILGLTDEEQLAVYRAVVELVKDRLVKARSV